MRAILFFVGLIAFAACLPIPTYDCTASDFDSYLAKVGRNYASGTKEYTQRLRNYCNNLDKLALTQSVEQLSQFDLDEYADLSYDEFAKIRLNGGLTITADDFAESCLKNNATHPRTLAVNDLPESFDWREKGAVSSVKNQGGCGSCWAFSTVGNLEGQNFLKTGKMVDLSPQDLVDCSKDCSVVVIHGKNETACNAGCGGGWMWAAMQTVKESEGIDTLSAYPYTGVDGQCAYTKTGALAAVQTYSCISSEEEQIQAELMARGPLSIAVNANRFQFYLGGVLSCLGESKTTLDHAILLVGWGVEKTVLGTKPYWIVKNSWGAHWGEKGYAKVLRGSGSCGINNAVTSANL